MKIAIDGTTLCDAEGGVGAGIEHYTWELVHALLQTKSSHTFLIFVPSVLSKPRVNALIDEAQSRVRIVRVPKMQIPFLSRHVIFPLSIALSGADILFSPFGQLPLLWRGKSIVTLHDVAIFEHPEWFADLGNQDFSTRVVVPKSIEQADRILAVTETTKQRLVGLFPDAQEKTSVVYEGVRQPNLNAMRGSSTLFPFDHDFVLYLGTIEPRKNLRMAVEAFDLFLQQHEESASTVRFIIAGKTGWGSEELMTLIKNVNHTWSQFEPEGVIRCLGAVTEEEKWSLLSRASVFVYPSLYEGFGLPVLEAMSVGTPVMITWEPALEEVSGDAAITVAINDVEGMSLAMAQCLLLPEAVSLLREDGISRSKLFSWQRTARETLQVIESI